MLQSQSQKNGTVNAKITSQTNYFANSQITEFFIWPSQITNNTCHKSQTYFQPFHKSETLKKPNHKSQKYLLPPPPPYLEEFHIRVLPHPPYSPDLSPCDLWLNPYIKSCLYNIYNCIQKYGRQQCLQQPQWSFNPLRS